MAGTTCIKRAIVFLALALLAAAGCATQAPDGAGELPVKKLCIAGGAGPVTVEAEVAEKPRQRSVGLKHRETLGDRHGMLFVFQQRQPGSRAFWMYETLIPLDIAYLDESGNIVSIRQMEPCTAKQKAGCPLYPARRPFRYALEVNRGFFDKHGVETGHRVHFDGRCPAP